MFGLRILMLYTDRVSVLARSLRPGLARHGRCSPRSCAYSPLRIICSAPWSQAFVAQLKGLSQLTPKSAYPFPFGYSYLPIIACRGSDFSAAKAERIRVEVLRFDTQGRQKVHNLRSGSFQNRKHFDVDRSWSSGATARSTV